MTDASHRPGDRAQDEAVVRTETLAPVARKAAELRRLELVVTRRLDGLLRGEFLGRQSGPGSEVAGARAYEAGDDSRWIDWNLTARSITPQVRTTEADRELQTWTIVDRSASMSFGTGDREKSEVAFAAAAAFGFLTARHGNRFGVLVAGGDKIVRLGPSSTRPELLATLSKLYDVPRRTTGSAPTPTSPRPCGRWSGPDPDAGRSSSSPTSSTRPTGERRWPGSRTRTRSCACRSSTRASSHSRPRDC